MCIASLAVATGIVGGTTLGAASVDVALVSAGLSIAASAENAKSAKGAAKFNEKAAENQASSARSVAAYKAGRITNAAGEFAATQKTTLAGSGFDVNTGDAVSIIAKTISQGARDAAVARSEGTIGSNAALVEAQNARIQGRSARNIAAGQIAGTVLSTAGTVADTWYRFHE